MLEARDIVAERGRILSRAEAYFENRPDVCGAFLVGSLADGSADVYSDIDLRVVALPSERQWLVDHRLDHPKAWGDFLFNEWIEKAEHCVSHFRPFNKVDVFYLRNDSLTPSPWYRRSKVLFDRKGEIARLLEASQSLRHPEPTSDEVSRSVSKVLACAHEAIRRVRRGELRYAHGLLTQTRAHLIRVDGWVEAKGQSDRTLFKLDRRMSPRLEAALSPSFVRLDEQTIENAVVGLAAAFSDQLNALYASFSLDRCIDADRYALDLVLERQVP